MTLDMTSGVPKIVFSHITESFIDNSIEIEASVEVSIIESDSSINNEIQRMTRGQSLENERGCDEIML